MCVQCAMRIVHSRYFNRLHSNQRIAEQTNRIELSKQKGQNNPKNRYRTNTAIHAHCTLNVENSRETGEERQKKKIEN